MRFAAHHLGTALSGPPKLNFKVKLRMKAEADELIQ